MDTATLRRTRWFWPWQDEKEEAWLEEMSQAGHHLVSVRLPCVYCFRDGEPLRYTYRLDYMPAGKEKFQEYLQIFQDAGWEYIGEMSNWRYWRKLPEAGETPEIFTDRESKLSKYRRLLTYMAFFLFLMIFLGTRMFLTQPWTDPDDLVVISAIYLVGRVLYVVVIAVYLVVVVQVLRRINQLKKKAI